MGENHMLWSELLQRKRNIGRPMMDTNWTFYIISVWLKKQLLESGSGFVSSLRMKYQSAPFNQLNRLSFMPASRTLCFFNQNEIMESAQCIYQYSSRFSSQKEMDWSREIQTSKGHVGYHLSYCLYFCLSVGMCVPLEPVTEEKYDVSHRN